MTAERPFYALSLGGGQVSTALLLAIVHRRVVNGYDFGQFAPLGSVTFADTGNWNRGETLGELDATYRHLDTLREHLAVRGVEMHVVRAHEEGLAGRVLARLAGAIRSVAAIPFWLGRGGRALQHCTRDFKSRPVDRLTKRLARAAGKYHNVEVIIGYEVTEFDRCRTDAADGWPRGWRWRYPLVEARVDRRWCNELCREILGYVPASSACAFCPHRPDRHVWIRENEPETWRKLVAFDAAIRPGYGRMRSKCFLTPMLVPVEQGADAALRQGLLFGDTPTCGRDAGRCHT